MKDKPRHASRSVSLVAEKASWPFVPGLGLRSQGDGLGALLPPIMEVLGR